MDELKDYSGEFIPNIRYEDFSREALAKLLKVYCKELLTIDAYWQEQVRKRLGEEVMSECLLQNWCRIGKHEMGWTMEALNITGDDVAAYVKANQMLPSFAQDVFDFEWDLKNDNHATLTVQYCPGLASLERNNPERIQWNCHVLEFEAMKAYMVAVNPAMQVRPLKLAPRQNPDEIACQWEFTIEE